MDLENGVSSRYNRISIKSKMLKMTEFWGAEAPTRFSKHYHNNLSNF